MEKASVSPTRPYAQPVSGLYQPRRFPYRRHTLGKPLPLVAAGKKLELSLTYTSRIGKEKQFVNEQNHTQRQRLDQRFSIQGEWQPDRRWLKKLSLRIDGSLQKSKQTKSQVNNASSQLYTDQKESGEWEANVLSSNYMYTLVNESRPFYVETEMLASTSFPLRQRREISLAAGFSCVVRATKGEAGISIGKGLLLHLSVPAHSGKSHPCIRSVASLRPHTGLPTSM